MSSPSPLLPALWQRQGYIQTPARFPFYYFLFVFKLWVCNIWCIKYVCEKRYLYSVKSNNKRNTPLSTTQVKKQDSIPRSTLTGAVSPAGRFPGGYGAKGDCPLATLVSGQQIPPWVPLLPAPQGSEAWGTWANSEGWDPQLWSGRWLYTLNEILLLINPWV